MLPRLQAQEQIAHVEAVSLGMGAYEAADRQRIMARLHDAAHGERAQEQRKARPASREQLAGIGIGVTLAPPKKARSDG